MEIKFEYKNKGVVGYQELIDNYPFSEFDSPYRSTVPFLHYWRNSERRLAEYEAIVGKKFGTKVCLSFEYCVEVIRGTGRPSQTDLMILSDDIAIAVEAKYTEPPYDTVEKWLGNSENRMMVLEGWVELIKQGTGSNNIRIVQILDLPYQMIHRCASVFAPNAKCRMLVYQCFDLDREKTRYYGEHLSKLKSVLHEGDNPKMYLINIPIVEKSAAYSDLQEWWDSGERKLGREVGSLIRNGNFLKFGEPVIDKF